MTTVTLRCIGLIVFTSLGHQSHAPVSGNLYRNIKCQTMVISVVAVGFRFYSILILWLSSLQLFSTDCTLLAKLYVRTKESLNCHQTLFSVGVWDLGTRLGIFAISRKFEPRKAIQYAFTPLRMSYTVRFYTTRNELHVYTVCFYTTRNEINIQLHTLSH